MNEGYDHAYQRIMSRFFRLIRMIEEAQALALLSRQEALDYAARASEVKNRALQAAAKAAGVEANGLDTWDELIEREIGFKI